MEAAGARRHLEQFQVGGAGAALPHVVGDGQQAGALHGVLPPEEQHLRAELVHVGGPVCSSAARARCERVTGEADQKDSKDEMWRMWRMWRRVCGLRMWKCPAEPRILDVP